MLTPDDLADALWEHLRPPAVPPRRAVREWERELSARRFLSDREVRLRVPADAREVVLPRGAIVSPLALEWLEFKKIPVRWT